MQEEIMLNSKWIKWLVPGVLLLTGICASIVLIGGLSQAAAATPPPPNRVAGVNAAGDYIVLSWNDLGMHCYNFDFQDLAVLPPYNTLWAQVVKVGSPPQVITTGVTVSYSFPNNTYSVIKSNFWTYAKKLFGKDLPDNIGLTGKGLSGVMDVKGDHFVAEGIPLTEFSDSAPTTRDPYQLARIVVRDANGKQLAANTVVAPVSTEMHCDYCHSDNGEGSEGIATGKVETNILTKHDQEEGTHLMNLRPVLCASCHSSNALGAPGEPGVPSLSNAMHGKHKDEVPSTLDGCYNCHPGPNTRCLRDIMSQRGMTCIDCHGTLAQVAQNPNPWFNEPRCDGCHTDNRFKQNNALYRFSSGHGGIYCEACHDSTHAIARSTQSRDAIKFIALQGHAGTLDTCTVCHASMPTGAGPHGILAPTQPGFIFTPDRSSVLGPGEGVTYVHTLHNTGNVSDTYTLTWSHSQSWSTVSASLNGTPVTVPGTAMLLMDQTLLITVTVSVPSDAITGTVDTTIITATSAVSPTLVGRVTDVTLVPSAHVYLPIIQKN
jgi:hypothetical protein